MMTNTASALADIELPPEIQEELATLQASRQSLSDSALSTLAGMLASKRDEAVQGRRESGIEDVWTYCEEAYIGIDDANRTEFGNNRWIKPPTMDGGLRSADSLADEETPRSNIFVRLTSRYVDAGAAKVQEILLAPDEKSFSFDATPLPEQLFAQKNPQQVTLNGTKLERDPRPEEVMPPRPASPDIPAMAPLEQPPQDLSGAPGKPLSYKDLADEAIKSATDKAKQAEKRVYDWLVECQHAKQMRRVIHDAARLGVGIIKGPIPDLRKAMALSKGSDGQVTLEIIQKLVPITQRVSPWDFFPDPACGEDIHAGEYCCHRLPLSRRGLQKLAKLPGYLPDEIVKVLREGPTRTPATVTKNPQQVEPPSQKNIPFEAWFFYGTMTQAELALIQAHANPYPNEKPDPKKELHDVPVLATLVNNRIIHAVVQPLESGEFPFHAMPWTPREGSWSGIGVSEQVMNPQRLVNAATRTLSDNGGMTAGLQLIIDRDTIEPADKKWIVKRNKIWWKKVGTGAIDDVRKAMVGIQFPNAQAQLSWIIEYAFRLAEESTSIPLVTQGWSGKTTPETATGQRLQDTNANQLLRSIALMFDDYITCPLIRQFYEWLLLDPDVPDEEKGDYTIFARGSTSLVERSIQDQTIAQSADMVVKGHALFGVNPVKWFGEWWKSKRLDPRLIQYTPEELQKLAQQPPPVPPQVQAAQINAQAELEQAKVNRELMIQELSLKRDLAVMEYANARQVSIEEVKSKLAITAMELRTQKELAGADGKGPQVAKPPTEPAGRAPNGEAYQK